MAAPLHGWIAGPARIPGDSTILGVEPTPGDYHVLCAVRDEFDHISEGERREFVRKILSTAEKARIWFTIDLELAARKTGAPRDRIVRALDYLAEQGWLGAAIPEAHGGLGLGHIELCAIAEELGREPDAEQAAEEQAEGGERTGDEALPVAGHGVGQHEDEQEPVEDVHGRLLTPRSREAPAYGRAGRA